MSLRVWNLLSCQELAILLSQYGESCIPAWLYDRRNRLAEARILLSAVAAESTRHEAPQAKAKKEAA